MGLDLTLCPIQYDDEGIWRAYNRLSLCRDYYLFSRFSNIGRTEVKPVTKPSPLRDNITLLWYNDDGLEKRRDDPYGTPLTYVEACEFNKIDTVCLNPWNRAVIEFIRSLPEDTPVVLWWS
jgi:hypothetical protein